MAHWIRLWLAGSAAIAACLILSATVGAEPAWSGPRKAMPHVPFPSTPTCGVVAEFNPPSATSGGAITLSWENVGIYELPAGTLIGDTSAQVLRAAETSDSRACIETRSDGGASRLVVTFAGFYGATEFGPGDDEASVSGVRVPFALLSDQQRELFEVTRGGGSVGVSGPMDDGSFTQIDGVLVHLCGHSTVAESGVTIQSGEDCLGAGTGGSPRVRAGLLDQFLMRAFALAEAHQSEVLVVLDLTGLPGLEITLRLGGCLRFDAIDEETLTVAGSAFPYDGDPYPLFPIAVGDGVHLAVHRSSDGAVTSWFDDDCVLEAQPTLPPTDTLDRETVRETRSPVPTILWLVFVASLLVVWQRLARKR